MIFDVVGFGFASAVLLVTFGKLITESCFSYLMIVIIQFEMVMFRVGLRRPLGSEANDQIFVESDLELSRNDASVKRTLTKRVKGHSK